MTKKHVLRGGLAALAGIVLCTISVSSAAAQQSKKQQRADRVDRVFNEYEQWIAETFSTEDQPFLRIAAVFVGPEHGG